MSNLNWLPGKREDQLKMASDWLPIIKTKGTAWKIDDGLINALEEAVSAAETETNVPLKQRSPITNSQLKAAFDNLAAVMRDIKKRHFFVPPLTEADIIALGLKPKDNILTSVGEPKGHAIIEITRGGMMQLKLNMKSSDSSDERAEYGCRIHYGVLPRTEVSAEKSPSGIRYLKKTPTSGDDLTDSLFTRKKKELFDFHPDDKGNTVYFCARYENSKGQKGPWGPVSSELIG